MILCVSHFIFWERVGERGILLEIGDVRSECAWLVLWIPLSSYPDVKAQYLLSLKYVFLRSA